MSSRWRDDEAAEHCTRYAAVGEALALRVYTSRLIGRDPELVLHGGGNTSVKATARDLFGRELEVLHVKGSGSDLAAVEPAGLPAVRLQPLRELRSLRRLDDEAMVAAVRSALLDPEAPNPSVETLLHAFLPHRYVDHTHANAILALTDQPDGIELARQAFGPDVPVLPWIMPGFPLAQAVADAHAALPHCRGIVLARHGLFTFGDSARESYERMLELVAIARAFLTARGADRPPMLQVPGQALAPAERRAFLARCLPVLRGALAAGAAADAPARQLAVARAADDLAAFAGHADAAALCATPPITPDHVIRTKAHYLWLPRAEAADPAACRARVAAYAESYAAYFAAHVRPRGIGQMLSPLPAVALVEGCGVVGLGGTRKAAGIAADIAEHTLRVKAMGQALGRYTALSPDELAAMEYWPLELKKLGKQAAAPLQGQVALVTGAAGAIGCGIAEVLLEQGACVCLVDIDAERLQKVAARLRRHGAQVATAVADLADAAQVQAAFDACVLAFGGVDCVVPNAGVAHVSKLADMDPARFRRVLEVNATGTMLVLQAAARVFAAQGSGGSVVVQASKNAFAPGAGFGAYSASKAAALQLGRIAALEFAPLGVTVNMINADAVFGDDEVPSQLWQEVGPERMRARNLDPEGLRAFYRDRSLLKRTVTPRHVGEAVAFFAAGRTPTTGAVLPVDGGLPEAFPR